MEKHSKTFMAFTRELTFAFSGTIVKTLHFKILSLFFIIQQKKGGDNIHSENIAFKHNISTKKSSPFFQKQLLIAAPHHK